MSKSTNSYRPIKGSSFYADLHLIRLKNGLSLGDVRRETMIHEHVIDEFERNGLINHPRFNKVYLNSLAGGYARALKISASLVKSSVEKTFDGTYRGELATEYLGFKPHPPLVPKKDFASDVTQEATSEDKLPVEKTSEEIRFGKDLARKTGKTQETNKIEREKPLSADKRTAKKTPRKGPYFKKSNNGVLLSLGLLLTVASLVAILWFLFSPNRTAELPENEQIPETVTLSEPLTPDQNLFVLPDTMSLSIVAADGAIQAMQVTRDGITDYPRWVETGDSVEVRAASEFELYKSIRGLGLRVNGRSIPNDFGLAGARMKITRSAVQSYLDSLGTESN